jgi:two-component system, OmpR family, sensor histidine kinase KdpD
MRDQRLRRDIVTACVAIGAIGLIVALVGEFLGPPNQTIAALLLLLVVLATATLARLRVAVGVSLAAVLAFNFFFFEPLYTFRIADPRNWVALFVFLAVANIGSQLSAAARQRAHEAEARRQEVSRLFDFSRDILLTTEREGAVGELAGHLAKRFELEAVAICLPGAKGWQLHQGGVRKVSPQPAQLDQAFAGLRTARDSSTHPRGAGGAIETSHGTGITLVPLQLATRPLGLLATDSSALHASTLDTIGGVLAIAIERAHFLRERKQAEALAQRAELASALLASFSHDLRTPLTTVRMAVANLQSGHDDADRQAQAQLALREIDRLNRLFQGILDMARIDAAAIATERQWVTPADVIDAAVAHVGGALDGRPLHVDADADCEVQVDPRLTSTALGHLLENAAQYSPAGQAIDLRGWADGDGLHLVVRDHGAGLDAAEVEQIFQRFHRGSAARRHSPGTGMGLAITRGLLAAEGGTVWGENARDGGAQFTIVVPAPVRAVDPQEI